jgi:hypothetical protein
MYLYVGSDAEPQKARFTVQVDGMYTSFLDDLYLASRSGVLASLAFQVEL